MNTPSTPTTIKGLQELVSVALTQGMTGQEIDQLIVQAVDHGTLIIPDTLRTPKGQPNTMAMLATLVDATTPTTPTLTRDVGNTYVVRPGDSLASIAVKYYGSTDAVNDIFWANKDRLSDPGSIAGWTDDIPTPDVISGPNPRLAFHLIDWLCVQIQKRPHPQGIAFQDVPRQSRSV